MSEKPVKEPEDFKLEQSNAYSSPSSVDMNDQQYRTLVHLLAVHWDSIKPAAEEPKQMKWSKLESDYIKRYAYGAQYTQDIGKSIWNQILEKYWQCLMEDVNIVKGSENMLEALNNIIAPANRYYYDMYKIFCQNLITLRNENISRANKQRITKFLNNLNLDNLKISNYEIFDLALPGPIFSLKDYRKFKQSLTGFRQPIAKMIFAHYFKGQPYLMPPYIPPDTYIVMPNNLKGDAAEDKISEDMVTEYEMREDKFSEDKIKI